uniref:Carboxylic ester hydrolase n=1 Tax=Plectus sambesii TaxID=2011161 RepID=A0A914VKA9_9BILA
MRSSPAQVALLVVAAFAAAEALRSTVVRTSLGTAKGKIYKSSNGGDGEALVFLGLPYAAPPVGALRYRQPQDPKPWSRILDASEYRSGCLSNTSFTTSPQTDIDEDCLYVNVFADRRCGKRSHAPCPVLFYIHGGGYSFDSASMFPVQALVDHFATRELVFVTVGYRLGSFGFLDLGSDDVVNRNIGFYDKIKALEWVQREIGKFGGDPKKVTIMGHSSGSMSSTIISWTLM